DDDRHSLNGASAPRGTFRWALGRVRKRVWRRGLLVLDAALGTRLIAQGLRIEDDDPCLWNVTRPSAVLAIHRRDIAAGAEALLTNTLGANRHALARLRRRTPDPAVLNRAAVVLARRAAVHGVFVIGSIGPTAADSGIVAEQSAALL